MKLVKEGFFIFLSTGSFTKVEVSHGHRVMEAGWEDAGHDGYEGGEGGRPAGKTISKGDQAKIELSKRSTAMGSEALF